MSSAASRTRPIARSSAQSVTRPVARPAGKPVARPHQHSDENFVITVVGGFLLLSLVLGTGGYQYWKHVQQQEQKQSDQRALRHYNDYVSTHQAEEEETPVVTPTPPTQASVPVQPSMAQKLREHPSVTPGPGFNMPGVQSTGVAIIEAIDIAQGKALKH